MTAIPNGSLSNPNAKVGPKGVWFQCINSNEGIFVNLTGLYQKSVYFRHKSLSQGDSVLMYKFTFFPRTIAQWNLLPVAAVQCTTLDSFWEKIPIYVLEQHFNI